MSKKNMVIPMLEIEELAQKILGLDDFSDFDVIEDRLYEEFRIDLEQLQKIASSLVMLTFPFDRGDKKHYCFIENAGHDVFRSIARIIVNEQESDNE